MASLFKAGFFCENPLDVTFWLQCVTNLPCFSYMPKCTTSYLSIYLAYNQSLRLNGRYFILRITCGQSECYVMIHGYILWKRRADKPILSVVHVVKSFKARPTGQGRGWRRLGRRRNTHTCGHGRYAASTFPVPARPTPRALSAMSGGLAGADTRYPAARRQQSRAFSRSYFETGKVIGLRAFANGVLGQILHFDDLSNYGCRTKKSVPLGKRTGKRRIIWWVDGKASCQCFSGERKRFDAVWTAARSNIH